MRLYRGEAPRLERVRKRAVTRERFSDGDIRGRPGLCKVATLAEIEAQGWSLNPGRYVGTEVEELEDEVFEEKLAAAAAGASRALAARAETLGRGVDQVLTQLLSG